MVKLEGEKKIKMRQDELIEKMNRQQENISKFRENKEKEKQMKQEVINLKI